MKRARFTEDQIIGVLKEHEAGAKTADLARKHGVSEPTLYNWKAKYGSMDVCEAKRLKQLGYLTPVAYAANLSATRDRLRNPDQLRRSQVAPPPPRLKTRRGSNRLRMKVQWQVSHVTRRLLLRRFQALPLTGPTTVHSACFFAIC